MNLSHPWAQHILSFEVPQAIKWKQYGDRNHWLTLGYDLAGDASLLRHAIDSLLTITPETSFSALPKSRNSSRESACYFAMLYVKLRPHMSNDEAVRYESRLRDWANYILANTHKGDSDEVVGHYFGLRAIDKYTGSIFASLPVCDMMRSEIRRYIQVAKGGVWPESSEYNLGTLSLICLGLSVAGFDEFPEFKPLLCEVTEHLCWAVTPDLKDCIQWGALLGQLIGLGCDPTGQGLALLAALLKGLPINHLNLLNVWRPIWCGFEPSLLESATPYVPPIGTRVAPGMGMVIVRTADSLAQVHFPPTQEWIDHSVPYCGDLRLWQKGEWVIDHIVAYDGPAANHNVGLMAGLGQMHRRSFTVSGNKITGETGGPRSTNTPQFVDYWVREIDLSTLTITDRFKGKPPVLWGYHQYEKDFINNRLALWAQVWHVPGKEWTTAKGTKMRLVTNATREVATAKSLTFLSDEPEAVIQTRFIIGEEPVPETALESRVASLETQLTELKAKLRSALE
jgi:hypothetical protein